MSSISTTSSGLFTSDDEVTELTNLPMGPPIGEYVPHEIWNVLSTPLSAPTTSDWSHSDVDFPDLTNVPTGPPVQENLPHDIWNGLPISFPTPTTPDRSYGHVESFSSDVWIRSSAIEHSSLDTQSVLLPAPITSECSDSDIESSNADVSMGSPAMEPMSPETRSILLSSPIASECNDSDVGSSKSSSSHSPQSPLLSDSSDNDDESTEFVNVPTRSLAMEDVPPEIRKLVCQNCWSTVFTTQAFHTAWEARHEHTYSESAGFSYSTPTWAQIKRQRHRHWMKFRYQCQWCKLVCWNVKSHYNPYSFQNNRRPPKNKMFKMRQVVFIRDLYCSCPYSDNYQDDPAARFIHNRQVLLDVDSLMGYSLIKKRIDDCLLHECCPQPCAALLPTRVIDCKDPDQPRLLAHNGVEDKYVALSYVWGGKQPHSTTTKNLESYIKGIPLINIPKTVVDAITVTRKLGLQYLWVDALCILQDSKDDKAREIARIRHIFRDAYVTIIAACTHRVSDGFLHVRTEGIARWGVKESMLLPFRCPNGGIGGLQQKDEAPKEPTDERAWCLEERVLSPRKLIYASHTLQYECQAIHVNVNGSCNFIKPDYFHNVPRLPDLTFDAVQGSHDSDSSVEDEVRKAWVVILQMYAQRTVTHPEDRLVAFSGIASHFQHYWLNSKYIAGLWEHQLPSSLMWYSRLGSECRPPCYRAPSWSWASVEGAIDVELWTDCVIFCTVIQWDVTVKRQINPYGQVKAGYLILETILQPAVWDPIEGELFDAAGVPPDHLNTFELESDEDEWVRIGSVRPDAIEPVSQVIGKVYLAIVMQDGSSLKGLVITPVTDQITNAQLGYDHLDFNTFRRVGWFMSDADSPIVKAWQTSSHRRIRII
ncbi:HET-domain-containing protein [Armillaria solidipes]|uniref:HET-domain-containing protein n=1 Tax=Armillaria solidipes TaxID=1076256 RepID=A0A2H3B7N3_9AGAR|nr:HET-domain-containing protein [Armillaria solidipes]